MLGVVNTVAGLGLCCAPHPPNPPMHTYISHSANTVNVWVAGLGLYCTLHPPSPHAYLYNSLSKHSKCMGGGSGIVLYPTSPSPPMHTYITHSACSVEIIIFLDFISVDCQSPTPSLSTIIFPKHICFKFISVLSFSIICAANC